jgi:hypothetical protein
MLFFQKNALPPERRAENRVPEKRPDGGDAYTIHPESNFGFQ